MQKKGFNKRKCRDEVLVSNMVDAFWQREDDVYGSEFKTHYCKIQVDFSR
jgi:hypothetical protein